jgi:hypothetical protein
MQHPWPPQSKKGFGDLLPKKNPPKFLFLKPTPLIDTMVTQVFLKKYFFPEFWGISNPPNQDTSLLWSYFQVIISNYNVVSASTQCLTEPEQQFPKNNRSG